MPAKTHDPLHVPDGHRPEEFLTDEQILALRQREFDHLKDDDPDKVEARRALARARAAAALTEVALVEATKETEA